MTVVETVVGSKGSVTVSWRPLIFGPSVISSDLEVVLDGADFSTSGREVVNAVTVLHVVDVEVPGSTTVVQVVVDRT